MSKDFEKWPYLGVCLPSSCADIDGPASVNAFNKNYEDFVNKNMLKQWIMHYYDINNLWTNYDPNGPLFGFHLQTCFNNETSVFLTSHVPSDEI